MLVIHSASSRTGSLPGGLHSGSGRTGASVRASAAYGGALAGRVDDVIAGLTYLKSQPFVDPTRIALSGCSYGGIQTLLIGEHDLGVRALVPFAPGAMSWDQNLPLRERLTRTVDLAKAPVFLIQAENDYSLAPSQVLSQEARRVPNATGTLTASPTAQAQGLHAAASRQRRDIVRRVPCESRSDLCAVRRSKTSCHRPIKAIVKAR
jgi:dienelactone hydrolase